MRINLLNNSEIDFTTAYDMSSGDENFSISVNDKSIGLHFIADSLTTAGTLDGEIKIWGGNIDDITKAVQIGSTIDLISASQNETIEKDHWNYAFIFVSVTVNAVTGGNLRIILNRV
jgi:hypothetical protein